MNECHCPERSWGVGGVGCGGVYSPGALVGGVAVLMAGPCACASRRWQNERTASLNLLCVQIHRQLRACVEDTVAQYQSTYCCTYYQLVGELSGKLPPSIPHTGTAVEPWSTSLLLHRMICSGLVWRQTAQQNECTLLVSTAVCMKLRTDWINDPAK